MGLHPELGCMISGLPQILDRGRGAGSHIRGTPSAAIGPTMRFDSPRAHRRLAGRVTFLDFHPSMADRANPIARGFAEVASPTGTVPTLPGVAAHRYFSYCASPA
jgi:hypothetical protein